MQAETETLVKIRIALLLVVTCSVVFAVIWWRWPRHPNVVLITVDTLRPDRLSAYGYTKHRTPNFDRLAQEGVLFENAFCDVTWTTPSMASVMTGRYATVHGLRTSYQRLAPQARTLAEVLRGRGMTTAAIVASFPLDSEFGLDQGFALYDDTFSLPLVLVKQRDARAQPASDENGERQRMRQLLLDKATNDAYRPDNEVSDRVLRWLREEMREPFFLWVHYFGPHEKPQPGSSSPAETKKLQLEQYDPDVVFADEQVGRVLSSLDEMNLSDHTMVILHSDHGQSLMEHGYFGHGRNVYDPSQRIPLVMRLPETIPAGTRVTQMVGNIDIFPTVLAVTGIQPAMPLDGQDLLQTIAGKRSDPEVVYTETYLSTLKLFATLVGDRRHTPMGFRRLSVRTPKWKFVINDPREFADIDDPPPVTDEIRKEYYYEELFDLAVDPGEKRNVVRQNREHARRLWTQAMEFQRMDTRESERRILTAGDRERLRSLGYLVD